MNYIIIDQDFTLAPVINKILVQNHIDYNFISDTATVEGAVKLLNTNQIDVAFCNISFYTRILDVISPTIFNEVEFIIVCNTDQENELKEKTYIDHLSILINPIQEEALLDIIDMISKKNNPIIGLTFDERIRLLEYNLTHLNKLKKIGISVKKGGYIFKSISDLIFIEAISNYTVLNFNDGSKHTLAKTLMMQEEIFEPYGFIRIHQSFLVNMDFVESYNTRTNVITIHKKTLPVSIRRKGELLNKIKTVI
jgi:two-component system, LytTR family, response regulator